MTVIKVSKAVAANDLMALFIAREPFVTSKDIRSINLGLDLQDRYQINIEFTSSGRQAMYRATENVFLEGRIAIMLDGDVIQAPYYSDPIDSSFVKIALTSNREECEQLCEKMAAAIAD